MATMSILARGTAKADAKPFRPLICLDFDGVLHSYTTKWSNAWTIPDPPVPGAIEWLLAARKDFELAILSSRSKSLRGRWEMKRWLRYWIKEFLWKEEDWRKWFEATKDLPVRVDDPWTMMDYDELMLEQAGRIVGEIKWPWFKPGAFLSIDDRAMCFEGSFPDAAAIRSFRPWNKR